MARTTFDLDPELLEKAMKTGGFKTKKQAVVAGLKKIAEKGKRGNARGLIKFRGSLPDLEIDLDVLRGRHDHTF